MRQRPLRSGILLGAALAGAFWIACSSDENPAPARSPLEAGGGEASSSGNPSGCPSAAPSSGDGCGSEGVSCGYQCASCTCTMGKWNCTGMSCGAHTACPAAEPAAGSSCAPTSCCPMSTQQTPCNYTDNVANCTNNMWTLTPKPPMDSGKDVTTMDSGDSGDSG